MCTAINSTGKYHLFGRTLDLECSYGERAVLLPRNFRIDFLHQRSFLSHLAIMGIACVREGYPLYYDAMNEAGLAMAALNFPDNAVYSPSGREDMNSVASFELIGWVLCQSEDLSAAEELLRNTVITSESFSSNMPTTPLHWIVADRTGAITVEAVEGGLRIYKNKFGVLTNNPPFEYHVTRLADFLRLTADPPQNSFKQDISIYSRGLGAYGLPGDFSSSSRFVRAVFLNENTQRNDSESREVSRFFHITDNLSVPRGSVKTDKGDDVITVYTSCACSDSLTYYFTSYGCRRIRAVRLCDIDTDSGTLVAFDINGEEDISVISKDKRE